MTITPEERKRLEDESDYERRADLRLDEEDFEEPAEEDDNPDWYKGKFVGSPRNR